MLLVVGDGPLLRVLIHVRHGRAAGFLYQRVHFLGGFQLTGVVLHDPVTFQLTENLSKISNCWLL